MSEPPILPDWLDSAMWTAWEIHRKEIKKKLTPKSVELQLEFLCRHKADHREIIKQSIMNGWTGLFELKGKAKQESPLKRHEYYKPPPSSAKATPEGLRSAIACLPAHLRKRLEKHTDEPEDPQEAAL